MSSLPPADWPAEGRRLGHWRRRVSAPKRRLRPRPRGKPKPGAADLRGDAAGPRPQRLARHDRGNGATAAATDDVSEARPSRQELRPRQGLTDAPDPTFGGHYENARAAGLIRAAFHWFTPRPVSDQVRLFLGLVPRLGPGDLAPALDLEDSSMALWQHYKYSHGKTGNASGSTALLDDVQDWLDRVEAALGRTPIIYTGVIWRDDLKSTRMSQYPLWTLPSRWFPAGGLGGWRRVELWQYAEDGTPGHGMTQYREAGIELPGVDYDAYNGTIYGLRGLADLGRTGVGLTPLGAVAAHCEPDRHLHLMRENPPRTWTGTDLMRGALPGLGGDPVLSHCGHHRAALLPHRRPDRRGDAGRSRCDLGGRGPLEHRRGHCRARSPRPGRRRPPCGCLLRRRRRLAAVEPHGFHPVDHHPPAVGSPPGRHYERPAVLGPALPFTSPPGRRTRGSSDGPARWGISSSSRWNPPDGLPPI